MFGKKSIDFADALLQCDWLFAWDGLGELLPDRDPELCEIIGIAAAWDFTRAGDLSPSPLTVVREVP